MSSVETGARRRTWWLPVVAAVARTPRLWGTALRWTTGFGIVPKLPAITAYIDRVVAHPAFASAAAKDAGPAPAAA